MGRHPSEKQSQRSGLLQHGTFIALRNQVERFFNRIKQCRRVATRYDSLAGNYLRPLASIQLWLAARYESTPWIYSAAACGRVTARPCESLAPSAVLLPASRRGR
jgi:hypothetical protein